ncbi:MAG TPA: hypothetical protein VFL72_01130, partial [Acidimicrobiia bacterium]|nr:hypothetical protein [Acidimicrobiia bacterium]
MPDILGLDTERPHMGWDPLHHDRGIGLDHPRQSRSRSAGLEDEELVDLGFDPLHLDLALVEETVDDLAFGHVLDETGMELLDGHGVSPIILNRHPELGSFDPKRRVLGDKNRGGLLHEVETGGKDSMIRCLGVEGCRQTCRCDP